MGVETDHVTIAAFCARLPVPADAERVRGVLASEFLIHADELWPAGERARRPRIAAHTDEIMAVVERLYAVAADSDNPGADEFLDRLAWLAPLLATSTGHASTRFSVALSTHMSLPALGE
jgi:hypothetical protein